MKVKAERTEGRYLKPGDIFSSKGPEFWSKVKTVSAEAFICMNAPDETDTELVYRLTIEKPVPVSNRPQPLMDPRTPPGLE